MITAHPLEAEHPRADADARETLRLWLRLLSCTTTIEKRLQRGLAADFSSSLTRFDILAALDRNPDGMTMSALACALLVSNGNVTGRVQTLRRDGYVEVVQLATDQRVSMVSLTPAGKVYFGEMASAHHGWVDEMLGDLPGEKRDVLFELLGDLKRCVASARKEAS